MDIGSKKKVLLTYILPVSTNTASPNVQNTQLRGSNKSINRFYGKETCCVI